MDRERWVRKGEKAKMPENAQPRNRSGIDGDRDSW